MRSLIENQIKSSIEAKQRLLGDDNFIDSIQNIVNIVIKAYRSGNKVLICGNGGSAADSQHIAAEFVSKFKMDRNALPAIALTVNTSVLTSIGNDYDYKNIFERQVEAFGKEGDVIIGISTSGNSENISLALKKAKALGMTTIGFLGRDGGDNKNHCDVPMVVPSDDTPRIQEAHIMIGHIMCELVEKELFDGNTENLLKRDYLRIS
ncbi:D-sedoheptulose 7-phosphate isomerase [Clostridium felsineum]|uniref:Phosphoheptose isomerase n=1 Tax=Clostridium felsineum TaxID=36839 RepID=A0A1S8LSP0_9CLOT|nr:D-sedoheptulose 7-phosphate isomerase [Clostridium felsineum]URZ08121.1 Phosphoheptose isomerase [Clostridium felsineum]URZ13152.1 Phosphoheptose isomerase [Clostridium felsineum]